MQIQDRNADLLRCKLLSIGFVFHGCGVSLGIESAWLRLMSNISSALGEFGIYEKM